MPSCHLHGEDKQFPAQTTSAQLAAGAAAPALGAAGGTGGEFPGDSGGQSTMGRWPSSVPQHLLGWWLPQGTLVAPTDCWVPARSASPSHTTWPCPGLPARAWAPPGPAGLSACASSPSWRSPAPSHLPSWCTRKWTESRGSGGEFPGLPQSRSRDADAEHDGRKAAHVAGAQADGRACRRALVQTGARADARADGQSDLFCAHCDQADSCFEDQEENRGHWAAWHQFPRRTDLQVSPRQAGLCAPAGHLLTGDHLPQGLCCLSSWIVSFYVSCSFPVLVLGFPLLRRGGPQVGRGACGLRYSDPGLVPCSSGWSQRLGGRACKRTEYTLLPLFSALDYLESK